MIGQALTPATGSGAPTSHSQDWTQRAPSVKQYGNIENTRRVLATLQRELQACQQALGELKDREGEGVLLARAHRLTLEANRLTAMAQEVQRAAIVKKGSQ